MEQLIGQAAPAGQGTAGLIKDGDTRSFEADVIKESMTQPVIVDFWAPWCGPCKTLGPLLEKAVQGAGGRVKLVKINVDENQQLAAQLRIQSIPAVYAFFQGRPVDGFMGAVPESQIGQFVDKLSQLRGQDEQAMVAEALEQAEAALKRGEAEQALGIYSQLLQHDDRLAAAYGGMIRALFQMGREDDARNVLAEVPADLAQDQAITGAAKQLELAAASAGAAGNIADLEERILHEPDDHQARIDLALAYYAMGRNELAAETLLESIRRDRDWNEAMARRKLLEFFEAWGQTDPLTVKTRRRLSSLLYA
ncbi:MAG: thioredoxin [Azospirillaceae bacterium]